MSTCVAEIVAAMKCMYLLAMVLSCPHLYAALKTLALIRSQLLHFFMMCKTYCMTFVLALAWDFQGFGTYLTL